jgi:hypothetical protein
MRYRVEVIVTNLETSATNKAERTVSVEREKASFAPHDPMPIDSDQKDRLVRWAIDEAAKDAVRERR